jgi:hypothetical protein
MKSIRIVWRRAAAASFSALVLTVAPLSGCKKSSETPSPADPKGTSVKLAADQLPGPKDELMKKALKDSPLPESLDPKELLPWTEGKMMVRGRIVLAFADTATVGQVNDLLNQLGARIEGSTPGAQIMVVRLLGPQTAEATVEAAKKAKAHVAIKEAIPDYVYSESAAKPDKG